MRSVTDLHQLLEIAVDQGASDLHLAPGIPPYLRIYGKITPISGFEALLPNDIEKIVKPIVDATHWEEIETNGESDFSYGMRGLGRFRCSVYRQRGSLSAAMRIINNRIFL